MTAPFREQLDHRAGEAGIDLTAPELDGLEQYWTLLQKWNEKINLTSLPLHDAPDETLDRLFIEPLVASALVSTAALRWYDLGSGGGSPAIPLKIMRPAAELIMVESRLRKTAFLREVVRTLNLSQVRVEPWRFEEIAAIDGAHTADLVTVRAVRADAALSKACSDLLTGTGRLLIFAGAAAIEGLPGFQLVQSVSLTEGTAGVHEYVPRGTS